MVEATSLSEAPAAVDPLVVGTLVDFDAGTGSIVEAHGSPSGQWWYDISVAVAGSPANYQRWHEELTPHPIEAPPDPLAVTWSPADNGQAPPEPIARTPAPLISREALAIADLAAVVDRAPPTILDRITADRAAARLVASTNVPAISILDLVVLRSGGPQMIVEKVDGAELVCWWMDHGGSLHCARLNRLLLDPVPAAFNHAEFRA